MIATSELVLDNFFVEKDNSNILQWERNKYLSLLNSIDQGVQLCELVRDKNGAPIDILIQEINSAWERIMQVKFDDIRGKKASEAFPGMDAKWLNIINKVVITGKSQRHENYVKSLDRWFEIYFSSLEGDYFICLFTDVSDRKRTEEEIRLNEARFRTVANLVPDLLWSSEPNGEARWFNEQWYNYTGQTANESLGFDWLNAVHPDFAEGTLVKYKEAIQLGTPLKIEEQFRNKNGEYRWFLLQASPVFDSKNEIIQWYGAAIDIHERKLLEESVSSENILLEQLVNVRTNALRESNKLLAEEHHFLQQVTNKSPHLIYVFDIVEDRFTYINKRTNELIGKSEDYFYAIGPHLFQSILHPADLEKRISYISELSSLNDNDIRSMDFRVWNGSAFRWFRSKESIFLKEDGKVKQVIGLAEDITYEKMLEEKIHQEENALGLN